MSAAAFQKQSGHRRKRLFDKVQRWGPVKLRSSRSQARRRVAKYRLRPSGDEGADRVVPGSVIPELMKIGSTTWATISNCNWAAQVQVR